jgi:hypothetical protein
MSFFAWFSDRYCQHTSVACPSGMGFLFLTFPILLLLMMMCTLASIGAYRPHLCPGAGDVQCCPASTPSCNGQCQDDKLPCGGSYV